MRTPPQPLPVFPKGENIVPLIKSVVEQHESLRNNLVNTITPDIAGFDNVIRPLAQLDNSTQPARSAVQLLQDVTGDDACSEAAKLWRDAEAGWRARGDLYLLLKAVGDNEPLKREREEEEEEEEEEEGVVDVVDAESRLWLERELSEYELSGHGGRLSERQIDQFKKGNAEIDALETKFAQNWQRNKDGVWYSAEELVGVPDDQINRWKEATKSPENSDQQQQQQLPPVHPIFVPFSNGGWSQILRLAKREETRRRMLVAFEKGADGNAEIVRNLFLLRDSQARLLGFNSYMEMRMLKSAVKSTKWVRDFLDSLRDGLGVKATEARRLLQDVLARDPMRPEQGAESIENVDIFAPWNYYYCSRLVQESINVDQSRISEFFPVENTAEFMLDAFASFLDLEFVRVPSDQISEENTWHEDVQIWSVWDRRDDQSSFLGYLYFDLMWRENKYPGAFNGEIHCGYEKPDGSRHHPATVLCCSFEKPSADKCTTLTHARVVTLFHELGHAIHDLVAKTKYVRFHGPRLASDFNETPSVMLENWCWTKDMLRSMSCHYTHVDDKYLKEWRAEHPGADDPPKHIPEDLLDSLIAGRNWVMLNQVSMQLIMAIFDMTVHNPSSHKELEEMDITQLHNHLRSEIRGWTDPGHESYPYPNYHLIVKGCPASTYSYLAAEAYAQDIFRTMFVKDPKDKVAWARYRQCILEHGGAYSGGELKMLEEYLGRPTNVKALIESL